MIPGDSILLSVDSDIDGVSVASFDWHGTAKSYRPHILRRNGRSELQDIFVLV